MKAVQRLFLILFVIITATTIIESTKIYAQVEEQGSNTEGTPTEMTKELSCEIIPDSGLLCSNSELGLCVLRTNMSAVNVSDIWNIVNPMLCEAGE
jgi:hypothetical protein